MLRQYEVLAPRASLAGRLGQRGIEFLGLFAELGELLGGRVLGADWALERCFLGTHAAPLLRIGYR